MKNKSVFQDDFKKISLSDIYLDSHNIRTPLSVDDQEALIHDMFENEEALELVESISKNGIFLNELPVVVKENNRYIVVEGNRRIAAMKAMGNPTLAPPKFRRRIKELAGASQIALPIKEIIVLVAPDRNSVTGLIASLHTVQTRRSWKPLRQAYFYQEKMEKYGWSVNDLVEKFGDEVKNRFIPMLAIHKEIVQLNLPDKIRPFVEDPRKFPITTLERMYKDSKIKDALCMDFGPDGEIQIKNRPLFEARMKKLVLDISKQNVHSRTHNTKDAREKYAAELEKIGIDSEEPSIPDVIPSEPLEDFPENTQNIDLPTDQATQQVDEPQTQSKPRKKLKFLFTQETLPFDLPDDFPGKEALFGFYNELSQLRPDKTPNVLLAALRTFLEKLLLLYFRHTRELESMLEEKKIDGKTVNIQPTLSKLLGKIHGGSTSIKEKIVKRDANTILSKLDALNKVHHVETWWADEQTVRTVWGTMEPFISYFLSLGKRN